MEFKRVVFRSLKARNTDGLNELVGNLAFRMKVGAEWLFLGRGLMSTPLASAHAIIRSRPDAPLPDLKLQLHHFSGKDRMAYSKDLGIDRSEEHTSELQSLMRISYAVFCLKKKKQQ